MQKIPPQLSTLNIVVLYNVVNAYMLAMTFASEEMNIPTLEVV